MTNDDEAYPFARSEIQWLGGSEQAVFVERFNGMHTATLALRIRTESDLYEKTELLGNLALGLRSQEGPPLSMVTWPRDFVRPGQVPIGYRSQRQGTLSGSIEILGSSEPVLAHRLQKRSGNLESRRVAYDTVNAATW